MSEEKYSCGNGLEFGVGEWAFNSDVSKVFQKHISSSVPGYHNVHTLVADLCKMHRCDGESLSILDIGCSLGEFERVLLSDSKDNNIHVVAVDSSEDMIREVKYKDPRINYVCCDGLKAVHCSGKYDIIVCLYTSQFMSHDEKLLFFKEVSNHLNPNGMFILADKIKHDDNSIDLINEKELFSFKIDSGFSVEEIMGKKKALQGVQDVLSEEMLSYLTSLFRDMNIIDISLNFACYAFYK